MSGAPPEAFRGHIDECLRDLNQRLSRLYPKGSKGAAEARRPLAEFCGVNTESVTRWLHRPEENIPQGLPRIKLMCHLSLLGYEVVEFEHIPRKQKQFAELIGFDVLSIDQATALLGYAKSSTLFHVLQGKGGVLEDREQKMWDIWLSRKDELHRKQQEARQKYALNLQGRGDREVASRPVREAKIQTCGLFASVKVMEAVLALLEDDSSEELSANLSALRPDQVQTILHLNARLNVISSQLLMASRTRGGDQ